MKHKWKLATGLVALAVVALAVVARRGPSPHAVAEAQLAAELARLDAADPDWRLADMIAAHNAVIPPAEANAADQLRAAAKLLPASYGKWNGFGPASNHLMDADTARAMLELHADCGPALAVARRVAEMPGGGAVVVMAPDPASIDWPALQKVRTATGLFDLDAGVLAYQNRPAEALAACRGLLNAARGGVGTEPSALSQLARGGCGVRAADGAERVLACTDSPDGLAELQAGFAEERAAPRLLISYRSQRAAIMQMLRDIQTDPAVAAASAAAIIDATPGARPQLVEGERFAVLWLTTGARRCDEAESRVRARLGCAEVALACECFRHRAGHFSVSLAELLPDLLAAVPSDPYTGGPLAYRILADGAAVEAGRPGTGFRLWNPALRRAPSFPPPAKPDPAPADPE